MRGSIFVATFALLGLAVGGAVWLRASLASAVARGEAYGRALAAAEAGVALAERNAALESLRRSAEQEAVALEAERDILQERLGDLEKLLAEGPDVAGPGAAPCLDARLVRALDQIRHRGRGAVAP